MLDIDTINFKLYANYSNNSKQPNYYNEIESITDSVNNISVLLPDNIVVVDADDGNVAKLLFNIYNKYTYWVKTNRGYHFYFKITNKSHFPSNFVVSKFGIKVYTALGLVVDYKKNLPIINNGIKNTECVTVKQDGKIREHSENKVIKELPLELYPIGSCKQDKIDKFDLLNITNGNRNDTLFKVGISLKNIVSKIYMYSDDIIEETLNCINDKILDDKLDSKELNGLINNILNKKIKTNDNNLELTTQYIDDSETQNMYSEHLNKIQRLVQLITSDILSKYIVIRYNENLYLKDRNINNVVFTDLTDVVSMGNFLKHLGIAVLNKQFALDITYQLLISAKEIKDTDMSIVFKNGYILNQDTGDVTKYNNEFSTIIINADYEDTTNKIFSEEEIKYRKLVDTFISFIADSGVTSTFYKYNKQKTKHDNGAFARMEVENVINQILGHCLMTKYQPQYAYFFTGSSGKNGKSTLFKMIYDLIGEDNSSAVSLDQMSENYNLSLLTNSLVNIGDDINNSFIQSSREFKTIVSNEKITIRAIREQPFTTRLFATLLFNCNDMPKFSDTSGGIERRLIVIPLLKSVKPEDTNERLNDELAHPYAKQRLIERALLGFKQLRSNKSVINFGEVITRACEEYFQQNDSIKGFMADKLQKNKTIYDNSDLTYKTKIELISKTFIGKSGKVVYEEYKEFCTNDGIQDYLVYNKFVNSICKKYGLEKGVRDDDWVFNELGDSKFIT